MGVGDDVKKLIEGADRVARRVSMPVHRRAMGLSYIYWSSISTAYLLVFATAYEFNIKALEGWMGGVVAGLIFALYYVVYRATVLRRMPKTGIRRIYVLAAWPIVAAYFATYALSRDVAAQVLAGTAFGLYLAFFYWKIVDALSLEPRPYDYAAWAAFAAAMAAGPFYYVAWYAAQLVWVLAGVASLLEAEEGYGV